MRVAIIGCGYVGLVAAACLAEIGHTVTCVDNDSQKIDALQAGETTIHEEFLPELLARHRGRRLSFTTSLLEAVRSSAIVFIAVGTPPEASGEADLSVLESVCHTIAQELTDFKVVVVKSTVPVGTNQWVRRILIRYGAVQGAFEVGSNPEFLREGSGVADFLYPDRIVVGSDNGRCTTLLEALYEPLTSGTYAKDKKAIPVPDGAPIPARMIVTSARSAELIKHASNAFLAMKISFINAIANICEAAGADVQEVCEGMGSDARIGPRFLQPGIGYGGSCFPKDLSALASVARECGYDFRLLEEVTRINEAQRKSFLRKVRLALWTLKGKRLAVLGLAFKGGTDDIRESPAIAVIEALLKEHCEIVAYDPAAMERGRQAFGVEESITFAASAYEAATDADALLILTDWEEFGTLDFERLKQELRHPIMIDGRNMYKSEIVADHGFSYFSVGRQEAVPVSTPASDIPALPSMDETAEAA